MLDSRSVTYRSGWILLPLLLLLAIALQAMTGAWTSDLVDADEPAHFISGLLVRDYLASGLAGAPLEWAYDYYAHYPKVAIGNWPPLFYGLQGIWMLLLPAHPISVLLLIALCAALVAWMIFLALRPRLGAAHALLGAVLFLVLRPVPVYTGMIMLELVLTLGTTVATWFWIRYLRLRSVGAALLFGGVSVLAVLTKGNALFLALVPLLTVVIGGYWTVLRSRGLWIAALLVLLLAGPWMYFFLDDVLQGWKQIVPTPEYVGRATVTYARALFRSLGIAGVGLALLGAWSHLRPSASSHRALWIVAAALIGAVTLFHLLVPAGITSRHLIPAYPALAMFVAAGAHTITLRLREHGIGSRSATALVLGGFALLFALHASPLPEKATHGYRAAAELVLAQGGTDVPTTSLIVSGAGGEGAFIARVAVLDRQRPSHTVWRGTSLLSLSTWAGRGYRLRTEDAAEVIDLLDQAAIEFVVVDLSVEPAPHHIQLREAIEAHPNRFEFVSALPMRHGQEVNDEGLVIYRVRAPARTPRIRQVPGYDSVETIR